MPNAESSELPIVEIFTDGACKGNPGPGGWGAILRSGGKERELSGGESPSTNNRMELMAAIEGLNALKKPCRVSLTTDSVYVRDGKPLGALAQLRASTGRGYRAPTWTERYYRDPANIGEAEGTPPAPPST